MTMKIVKVKQGPMYLKREDLLVRESADEPFGIIMDESEKGKLFPGQEALVTDAEVENWGPEYLTVIGEIDDEKVRSVTGIPTRRDRMQRHAKDRVLEMASRTV
jgi:hypothetical protein